MTTPLNIESCKNCGKEAKGDYCYNCGQKTRLGKVTFKETFTELKDAIFSVNAPLLSTLKLLFINPGMLFRDYLGGKRKRYYKPVSFFIITTLIYLLIKSIVGYNPFAKNSFGIDSQQATGLAVEAGYFMFRNIDKIMFLFVFTLALSLKVFFYKKYSLAEYLVISFYILGIYALFAAVNMFVVTFINAELQFLALALLLVYLLYALISLFQTRRALVFFKTLLVYGFGVLFYMVFGFGFSVLIVWLQT